MRLTAVGIDGGTGVAQRAHQIYELVGIPLEGVVIVINQDSIRPTLVGHLEGFDNPVVTSLTLSAQRSTVGCGLMACHGFIDHINHRQVRIALLGSIHPLFDGLQLF